MQYKARISGLDASRYPGHLPVVIEFYGCNLKCPFCYAVDLIKYESKPIPLGNLISRILYFKPVSDGVVLTGGEPTLQNIVPLVESLKKNGFGIKLETNGLNPRIIGELVHHGLLDSLSISLKSVPRDAEMLKLCAGKLVRGYWKNLLHSLEYGRNVDLELVYIIIPGITDDEKKIEKASLLARRFGARLVLEEFDPEITLDPNFSYSRPSLSEMYELASYSLAETWIKTRKSGYDFVKP